MDYETLKLCVHDDCAALVPTITYPEHKSDFVILTIDFADRNVLDTKSILIPKETAREFAEIILEELDKVDIVQDALDA